MGEEQGKELERLRADLEVFERYGEYGASWTVKELRNKIAALEAEAADPHKRAKFLIDYWRNSGSMPLITVFCNHLTTENARLEKRVAELEAALKRIATVPDCGCVPCRGQCDSAENLRVNAEEIREIARISLEGVKPVADMQPPFEGPIVGLEPILDPARVLATAAGIMEKQGWIMTTKTREDLMGNVQPYRVKGVENV